MSTKRTAEQLRPHMFKPGQSGNPKGLPKGTVQFKTRLLRRLEEQLEFPDFVNNKKKKAEIIDAVVDKLITMALKGNTKALEMIIDRIDGPLKQRLEQTSIHQIDMSQDQIKKIASLIIEEDG